MKLDHFQMLEFARLIDFGDLWRGPRRSVELRRFGQTVVAKVTADGVLIGTIRLPPMANGTLFLREEEQALDAAEET
jgi:hypothetical protein